MSETIIVAFTTFFATIGPVDVAAMFAGMTARATAEARRSMALRGALIATIILFTFAIFGKFLLWSLGISLPALRIAGGILLLLIGIDMVFARPSGGVSTNEAEAREARAKEDIAVFPLATPLIAGPGAISAAILLMANTQGNYYQQIAVLLSLAAVLLITLVSLLAASRISRLLGVTGLHVVSRIFGILLSALAVQFVIDGVAESFLKH